ATPGSGAAPRTGSGFGSPFAPGPAAGAADPQRLGAGGGRPLLDRIERIADNLAPQPLSTVYNPQAFAALQARVDQLENRLRALESRTGGSPATPPASGGSQTAPGFGAPTAPSTTPGFGPPGGAAP